MVSTERTIRVAPDDPPAFLSADRIPVDLTGFADKVYLDWPDYRSAERDIRQAIESDTRFGNVPDGELKQPADVDDRADAIEYLIFRGKLDDGGVPTRQTQYCLSLRPDVIEHVTNDELRARIEHATDSDVDRETWQDIALDVGEHFARRGVIPCNRTGELFLIPEWGRPTGSYVATVARDVAQSCPECGADKSEHWRCVKSPASIRKPNVYKCDECGHTKRGITTG